MAEENENKKEVLVDFDGSTKSEYSNVLLDDDTYAGKIVACELVEVPNYEGTGTSNKIVFSIKLVEVEGEPEIPLYANPVVKKAGGTKGYSNSKLYDLLEASGELENARGDSSVLETFEGLHAWLESALVGRECKVLSRTANKGKENAYSVVERVIKFSGEGRNAGEQEENKKEAGE